MAPIESFRLGLMRTSLIRYGGVKCGRIRCSLVWNGPRGQEYGMVRWGLVRSGLVGSGTVWTMRYGWLRCGTAPEAGNMVRRGAA